MCRVVTPPTPSPIPPGNLFCWSLQPFLRETDSGRDRESKLPELGSGSGDHAFKRVYHSPARMHLAASFTIVTWY